MNKRLLISVGLCALMSPSFADGGSRAGCSAQTTRGTWVYTCEGTLPAPAQTATRILGRCSASRAGYFNCLGTHIQIISHWCGCLHGAVYPLQARHKGCGDGCVNIA